LWSLVVALGQAQKKHLYPEHPEQLKITLYHLVILLSIVAYL
jgi:hypothetical protein